MNVTAKINADHVIEMRRYLHENPGVSRDEKEACALVRSELSRLNVPFTAVGDYGTLGVFDTGKEGPVTVLRADMDALPAQESTQNNKTQKPCVSKKENAAHLCGHDAHTAMLLGAVEVLLLLRSDLCGKILFAFEADEETGSGYAPMLEALEPYHPTSAWGLHVFSGLESSTVAIVDGPCTAGGIYIEIKIHGESAHGSMPYQGKDALLCAAHAVTSLQNVVARELPPHARSVLSIGELHSGTASNIIADLAHFSGTCRYYDPDVGRLMDAAIRRIIESSCTAFGCTAEYVHMRHVLPTVNDETLVAEAVAALKNTHIHVVPGVPMLGSETFANYGRLCPTIFGFLGVGNDQKGTMNIPMHNPKFDIDEDALAVGVAATLAFALEQNGVG